jgi:hypothetical protein
MRSWKQCCTTTTLWVGRLSWPEGIGECQLATNINYYTILDSDLVRNFLGRSNTDPEPYSTLVSTNLFMKNSFTILHILKKKHTEHLEKIFVENRGIDTSLELFFYWKKNGRELKTLALVEWDVQPVLLQVVEAASCRRRHETKHSLMTQYLR